MENFENYFSHGVEGRPHIECLENYRLFFCNMLDDSECEFMKN